MEGTYPRLCSRCQDLIIEIPSQPKGYSTTEHNTVAECNEGAAAGCEFCSYVLTTTLGPLVARYAHGPMLNLIGSPETRMQLSVYGDPPLIDIKIGAAVIAKDLRIYTLPCTYSAHGPSQFRSGDQRPNLIMYLSQRTASLQCWEAGRSRTAQHRPKPTP